MWAPREPLGRRRGPRDLTPGKDCSPRVAPTRPHLNLRKNGKLAQVLQWTGGDRDLERRNPHSTCPAHGRPGPFERTQSLPSERDVLLGGGEAFGLEELSAVLVTEDRMHGLQEVLAALWGATKRRCTCVRATVLNTRGLVTRAAEQQYP